MSLKNFCLFLFLIKCFIRNWFGLGVNSIFIINAYIILWANLMTSVYAFIFFAKVLVITTWWLECFFFFRIWHAYWSSQNMVKRVVPEIIINIRSIGTPSEKLRPNPIWAQISHWKFNGWVAKGLFVNGKYGKLHF